MKQLLIMLAVWTLAPMALFAQSIQSIYSFTDGNDGANPYAGLTLGPDGNFYGTASKGGSGGNGTVFRVTTNGVLTPIYSFTGGNGGANPYAALTLGPDGNFYGTTSGGTSSHGTVFRVATNGDVSPLYSFIGGISGASPYAALTLAPRGNFYGTTEGGTNGNGTVFQMATNGGLTPLYSFTGGIGGANPYGALALGPDGNFYGTTEGGGGLGAGTVFRVATNGGVAPIYSFTDGNDGANPYAALALGPDGNFYGVASGGGSSGKGTIFQVTTNGVLTPLYSFTGGNDGANPHALMLGLYGNFYGTTSKGGSSGNGTVFRVTMNGAFTPLYSFLGGINGADPIAGLTLGPDGNLYGTTFEGGSDGVGVIYRLNLSVAPIISQAALNSGGNMLLSLITATNVSSQIEVATNLAPPVVWQPVYTNLNGGSWQFTDTNTSGINAKYYRLSTP
jgi:uncharacterized repeat protein (TIGR03803 family)